LNQSNRYSTCFLTFVGITLLTFIYREWVTLATPITLFYDEAYYLSWAQNPDWGYYSKPPVVGWLIALTTGLFGNAEWAVKLAAPVLYCLTALVAYRINRRLFSEKAGFYAGLAFLLMPLVSLNSLFITTDAPQLFFWSCATYAFIRARDNNAIQWWILAGCFGGLGLLSKYTFVLLPVAFLCFAVVSDQGKKILTNPRFWIACAIAVAFLLPNLYWNYQHDFISFQHTSEISKQGEKPVSFGRMAEFWGLQLLVFGPVLLVVMLAQGIKSKQKSDNEKLLWCLFWPTIFVISAQALLAKANMNWAAAAYVSASLLTGFYLSKMQKQTWLKLGLAANILLMAAFYHFNAFTDAIGVERQKGNDPYKRINGWPEFVQQFQPYFNQYPDYKIASDHRKLLAYFGYYLTPQDFTGVSLDGDFHVAHHYDLKYPLYESSYDQFLFITDKWTQAELSQYFDQVELLTEQTRKIYDNYSRDARLYKVEGFKGKSVITPEVEAK